MGRRDSSKIFPTVFGRIQMQTLSCRIWTWVAIPFLTMLTVKLSTPGWQCIVYSLSRLIAAVIQAECVVTWVSWGASVYTHVWLGLVKNPLLYLRPYYSTPQPYSKSVTIIAFRKCFNFLFFNLLIRWGTQSWRERLLTLIMRWFAASSGLHCDFPLSTNYHGVQRPFCALKYGKRINSETCLILFKGASGHMATEYVRIRLLMM